MSTSEIAESNQFPSPSTAIESAPINMKLPEDLTVNGNSKPSVGNEIIQGSGDIPLDDHATTTDASDDSSSKKQSKQTSGVNLSILSVVHDVCDINKFNTLDTTKGYFQLAMFERRMQQLFSDHLGAFNAAQYLYYGTMLNKDLMNSAIYQTSSIERGKMGGGVIATKDVPSGCVYTNMAVQVVTDSSGYHRIPHKELLKASNETILQILNSYSLQLQGKRHVYPMNALNLTLTQRSVCGIPSFNANSGLLGHLVNDGIDMESYEKYVLEKYERHGGKNFPREEDLRENELIYKILREHLEKEEQVAKQNKTYDPETFINFDKFMSKLPLPFAVYADILKEYYRNSSKRCNTNFYTPENVPMVFMVTTRDVKKDEEFFVPYGPYYWLGRFSNPALNTMFKESRILYAKLENIRQQVALKINNK